MIEISDGMEEMVLNGAIMIGEMADMYSKMCDDKRYKELTDQEWNKILSIRDIMQCKDEKTIRFIRTFVQSITR